LENLGKNARAAEAMPFFTAAEREAAQLRLTLANEKARRSARGGASR